MLIIFIIKIRDTVCWGKNTFLFIKTTLRCCSTFKVMKEKLIKTVIKLKIVTTTKPETVLCFIHNKLPK